MKIRKDFVTNSSVADRIDSKMELKKLNIKEFLILLENNFINGNISVMEAADIFEEYVLSKIGDNYEN